LVLLSALAAAGLLEAAGGGGGGPLPAAYATVPAGFSDKLVAGGLELPTAMEFSPDGRLFVSEKGGTIRIIKNGTLLPAPFASLQANSEGERGLMGIAFDPNFTSNRYLYVYYTAGADPVHNRVSRLTADPSNPDRMLAGSELPILDLEPLVTTSHNAGALEFGPDGKLYIATGDNYYPHLAQSLTSRFGKILRINPDGTIPADNPFYNTPGAKKEIWALGLRNPFTIAFSRPGQQQQSSEGGSPGGGGAGESKMYINDVGQDSWEEINLGQRGANYGWPLCEGACPRPQFISPVYTYPHPSTNSSGSSITGGAFYNGEQFPSEYRGSYFFGDYVQGFIKRLAPDGGTAASFLTDVDSPVDLKVGPAGDGSLYYLSIVSGQVHKVQYTTQGNYEPVAAASANRTSGLPPLAIDFDGSKSTDQNSSDTLSYTWDFGDGSAPVAGAAKVKHTYNATGPYVATLTVSDGKGGSSSDTISITVGNPPAGTIQTPPAGTKYSAGDVISFSGDGSDVGEQDGKTFALPASAFHWKIDFHHNTHTHPFQEFDGVKSGSFTVPKVGETDNDVWYRIQLKVTDSSGLVHQSTRDILPNKSTVNIASNVTGTELLLDGQPRAAPFSFVGVVGAERTLEAPAAQTVGNRTYNFQSWSDGGQRAHTITIPPGGSNNDDNTSSSPEAATTITARYSTSSSPLFQHTITVRSADIAGNPLAGQYLTVESPKGTVLKSGYTPLNFTGYQGTKYSVIIRDYSNSTFDHWDGGSTNRERQIELDNDMLLTAYYRVIYGNNSNNGTAPAPVPVSPPASPLSLSPSSAPAVRMSNLTISSVDLAGNARTGHRVTIESLENSTTVQAGNTTLTYAVIAGKPYRVTPQDAGDMVFDHWENGSTDRARTIILNASNNNDSTTTITAYYKNSTQTTAAPAPSPPPSPPSPAPSVVVGGGSAGGGSSGGGSAGGGGGGGGGGSGGGGGISIGSSGSLANPVADVTHPATYFVARPLEKVQLQTSHFVSRSSGSNADIFQARPGEEVSISTSFKNYQQDEQSYAAIIEVIDPQGFTTDIGLATGNLAPGETASTDRAWTVTGEQGTYTVKMFVWDSVGPSPIPLSEAKTMTLSVIA
jgi:glucose/arabinose dehydrogenase